MSGFLRSWGGVLALLLVAAATSLALKQISDVDDNVDAVENRITKIERIVVIPVPEGVSRSEAVDQARERLADRGIVTTDEQGAGGPPPAGPRPRDRGGGGGETGPQPGGTRPQDTPSRPPSSSPRAQTPATPPSGGGGSAPTPTTPPAVPSPTVPPQGEVAQEPLIEINLPDPLPDVQVPKLRDIVPQLLPGLNR